MKEQERVLAEFDTFGGLLKHLRRQARITQRELSIAVGYSEAQISRLESNERAPDLAAVTALFIPALGLDRDPNAADRLVALAKPSQGKAETGEATPERESGDWPLRSRPRTNLLLELSSFIGREQDIQIITQTLSGSLDRPKSRMLTLAGSGGVGKTRLALRVGMRLMESFSHGVWLVPFAPIGDPTLVTSTVIGVLGFQSGASKPDLDTLVDYLQTREMLLIFDNCEHVIDAAAHLAEGLLMRCSGLSILATSREPLGLPGENTYRVPSLALPDEGVSIDQVESVRLFVERAQSTDPGFTLSPANQGAVTQICRRLDGIPLAIELAAARVGALSIEQIAGRLDDAFHLLTSGSRTVLPRQQTIHASIDWSYRLLSDGEKMLLARMSVFVGGWTVEMAEAVCADITGGLHRDQIYNLLALLVTKSLVSADFSRGPARYWMLETIRQYAKERLQAAGETAMLRDRHLSVIHHWVEVLEPHLRGPNQVELLDRLEEDLPNLRAALEWSLVEPESQGNDIQGPRGIYGLELASMLRWLWHIRSIHTEGVDWLRKLLEVSPLRSQRVTGWISARARGLSDLAFLNLFLHQYLENIHLLEESDALFRSLGEQGKRGLIRNLYVYETTLWAKGEKQRGEAVIKEMLALAEEVGDRFNLADALDSAVTYAPTLQEALKMHNQALAIRRELGDIDGMFSTLFYRAHNFWFLGDSHRAMQDATEALFYAKKSKNRFGYLRMLLRIGWMRCKTGDILQGLNDMEQVLTLTREVENDIDLCARLITIGAVRLWLNSHMEKHLEVERYFDEALSISKRISMHHKMAEALFYLAESACLDGDTALAEERYRIAAAKYGELSEPWAVRIQQYSLGKAALALSDPRTARQHFQRSLRIVMELNYPWEKYYLLTAVAQTLAACVGEESTALVLQGAADANPPMDNQDDFGQRMLYIRYDPQIVYAAGRAALGEEEYSALYAHGKSLTVEQASEVALRS